MKPNAGHQNDFGQQMPMDRDEWPDYPSPDLGRCFDETQAAASPLSALSKRGPILDVATVRQDSNLAMPDHQTVTISVIAGPSKGLMHQFTKPRVSIGITGGGADIEIDDPQVSSVHCVVGLKRDMLRLCDLDSANGTYINDEPICRVGLEHLSEFRVGSSLLLVTIVPKYNIGGKS